MSIYNEISFTSNDGLKLYAKEYTGDSVSEKHPVICIHGLTRNSSDFEEIAPLIARTGRRVIAVDVRGRGQSSHDPDPSHYNPMVYANDVIKLAHDLGITRAVFIGTSMGGIITMTLALRKLGLISAAILNDVGPVISQKGLNRITAYAGKDETLDSWDVARDYIKKINQEAFPENTDAEWEKWARRAFIENSQGKLVLKYDSKIAIALKNGKIKTSSLIAKWAFRRLTKSRPTLLIRGNLSDLIEPEQVAYMRKVAPSMQYAEVPMVGHAPMLTEPIALDAILKFLSRID
jgi:pimeloyl-ACP methyl ester carboxylesterase